ncbi:ABHD1 [Scenedesmus sp. PABB004]|nr:ABHD1 [Scenedesmus sp. PABB004]
MSPPQLFYRPGGIAAKVVVRADALRTPFNPTLWAPNPHMQSALGRERQRAAAPPPQAPRAAHRARPRRRLRLRPRRAPRRRRGAVLRTATARGGYSRQLVMTSDHGTLGLDWWCGADRPGYAADDAPVVMFIHGINGGSHEGYVKWACVAAAARGWRPVVLNLRGCNGLALTSARGYNAINTGDVHVAVASIRSRFPAAPLLAVGYSLGSVLLAKYLAEADNGLYSNHHDDSDNKNDTTNDDGAAAAAAQQAQPGRGRGRLPDAARGSGLVGAALVSPPVCLHSTNARMGRPNSLKFMYNLAVAYKLREYVKAHAGPLAAAGTGIDGDAMLGSWTVGAFDDAVTLRLLGYAAPALYYRHACSTNYIPHIRTPTLILLSRDDPFLGVLPRGAAEANPFTCLAATRRGGHLAFLQGWWPLGASYCDAVVDDFLAAALTEWRHGCDSSGVFREQQAPAAGGAPAPAPAPRPLAARGRHGPAGRGAARLARAGGGGGGGGDRDELDPGLPSWVERALWTGWTPQPFDPSQLADVLCSCSPDPPGAAPQAAAPGAAPPAAPGAARGAGGGVRHSWSFGFGGRGRAGGVGGGAASAPGLRGGGAWESAFDEPGGGDAGRAAALRPLRSRL